MEQYHTVPMSRASARAQNTNSLPLHARGSMTPRPWRGFVRGLRDALGGKSTPAAPAESAPWRDAARRRRRALIALVVLITALAAAALFHARPVTAHPVLQGLQTGLFALLFSWIAIGCVTAVMGFHALLRGDRHMLSRHSAAKGALDSGARTALIMPICNENVNTVFAGLRATCESLAATDAASLFDVYILSDSNDPALRAAERDAWAGLRAALGNERIYYRLRHRRSKRKAGNVADFCRRWGRNYRYMVVLDADSVMSGDSLATLVRLMEVHPQAGILQTVPHSCGHATLHARMQQFAARVTGRLFAIGMQFWQLGEAHYWGHNAIIRVAPFMQHCALATLPGKGALGGDILSHDFVEAALMRRAGYQVWLVPDLAGSYEQQPPHILAELQRDRRWCQGNLQNAQLITEPGLSAAHRAMLATGAMAYLSAPLWLGYIALGALPWLSGNTSFMEHFPAASIGLWVSLVAMLALPRALGVLAVRLKGEQHFYGGTLKLMQSAWLEALLSMLQAPLRMAAHTLFIVGALTGWKLEWVSPPREATGISWREAVQRFAPASLTTLAATAALALLHPSVLIWMLPVILPLLLAAPLAVWMSRSSLGERIRAAGLLLTPEESWPPAVLRRAREHARRSGPPARIAETADDTMPLANAARMIA